MAGTNSADEAAVAIERELTYLSRALEALQRKRSYPLERAAFIILRTLSEGGSQSVGRLARALLLDDSTATRQVAAMEEKGFVVKVPDPADRRAGLVSVTLAGEAAMRDMLALRQDRVSRYVGDWAPADRQAFGRLLERFNARLVEALGE